MTRTEYLDLIANCTIADNKVSQLEALYRGSLPIEIKQMISFSLDAVFFDDDYRTLSLAEMLDAKNDLHVDFIELRLIPVVDCGENDFIVYNFESMKWAKFNIVDASYFKERDSLKALL